MTTQLLSTILMVFGAILVLATVKMVGGVTFRAVLCMFAILSGSVASSSAESLSLVITYDVGTGLDQVATALTNHGHAVDTILSAAPGDLAGALGVKNYTNVFFWDIGASIGGGASPVPNSADLSALAVWYTSHNNIVIDGRSYGAYFNGILGDEGKYLDNVADVFNARGGGLWVGSDNTETFPAVDWTLNANAALGALGFNPIVGDVFSNSFFVDNSNPIMAGVTASNLLWDWSAGEVPVGLQPNGTTLGAIGWDENQIPLISTYISVVPEPNSLILAGCALAFIGLSKISKAHRPSRIRWTSRPTACKPTAHQPMKSVESLPTAGPPQWIGNDGDAAPDTMGLEVPAQRSRHRRGSRRGVPAGGQAAAVGVVAGGSVGRAGRRRRCPWHGFQFGLPVADGQKTTLRRGRNWYGGRRRGRLGARTGNVRQGDTSMNSTPEERPLRRRLVAVFVPGGLGLLFLFIALNRPTIANMRFHDLVFLLATGACLGVGLSALVRYFVFRRKG
jgi:hypothetical protein